MHSYQYGHFSSCDHDSWHTEGNICNNLLRYEDAVSCYSRALAARPEAALMSICIQYAAVTAEKMDDHAGALAWSSVAVCLDLGNSDTSDEPKRLYCKALQAVTGESIGVS